jgi:hypothetical protein
LSSEEFVDAAKFFDKEKKTSGRRLTTLTIRARTVIRLFTGRTGFQKEQKGTEQGNGEPPILVLLLQFGEFFVAHFELAREGSKARSILQLGLEYRSYRVRKSTVASLSDCLLTSSYSFYSYNGGLPNLVFRAVLVSSAFLGG